MALAEYQAGRLNEIGWQPAATQQNDTDLIGGDRRGIAARAGRPSTHRRGYRRPGNMNEVMENIGADAGVADVVASVRAVIESDDDEWREPLWAGTVYGPAYKEIFAATPLMVAEKDGWKYTLSLQLMKDGDRQHGHYIIHALHEEGADARVFVTHSGSPIMVFVEEMTGKPGTRMLVTDHDLTSLLIDNYVAWAAEHFALIRAIDAQQERDKRAAA
jgi:hypothetical protein